MSTDTSVGLYIHVPFCAKRCPYCAFYSEPIDKADPGKLVDTIFTELDLYGFTEPVETIYIGGGSPTCLPQDLLIDFVQTLRGRFGQVEEFTIECNPTQANMKLFEQLSKNGINRLSIGAQSFDSDELKTLGRIHQPQQINKAVDVAKAGGFQNIGVDLIFAIPSSTITSWIYSLEHAAALDVKHISTYSLTIEKNTSFDRAIRQGMLSLIDDQMGLDMYNAARQILPEAGFKQYEISNFAKSGFECKHNLRYWKNLPVIGVGPAAATWYRGKRMTNVANITEYMENIQHGQFCYAEEQTPAPEQIASETAVLGLRMTDGINLLTYKKMTGFDLLALSGNAIRFHCDEGILECTQTHCRLTEKGVSFADTVARDFVL